MTQQLIPNLFHHIRVFSWTSLRQIILKRNNINRQNGSGSLMINRRNGEKKFASPKEFDSCIKLTLCPIEKIPRLLIKK